MTLFLNRWQLFLILCIGLGSAALLGQTLVHWFKLKTQLQKSSEFVEEIEVFRNNRFNTAFAFLDRIYVPDSILSLPKHELARIIAHERSHIDLNHGKDNIVFALVKSLFWYNPIYWFLHRELRMVHEFQADEQCALDDHNHEYSRLLLKLSTPGLTTSLIHPFSKNLIKKRVIKLNQSKSSTMKKALFILALPMCGMLFYAFSINRVQLLVSSAPPSAEIHNQKVFILPVALEKVTKYTPYGMRENPFTHDKKLHKGIDLVAAEGTEILAAGDGIVNHSENSETGYGNQVELMHENGLVTRYAHLQKFIVANGAFVRQGEVIGYCGSTGLSTGPHLHFEVLENGVAMNPENYLTIGTLRDQSLKVDRSKLVIVIDAGHGGKDAGVDKANLKEKDLTLAYAQSLSAQLKESGYKVEMTRDGDKFIPLLDRGAGSSSDEALFISLHFNYSDNPETSGIEIYIPSDQIEHRLKSAKISKSVNEGLLAENLESRGVQEANFVVLKNSKSPALLLELGFLSNETELAKIKSEDYKARMIEAIIQGINHYAQ